MNEIEKMYEKAGFQKKRKCEWDKDKESCFHSGFVTCDKCTAKIERTYSPFTAEKQIELIKWLARKEMLCRLEDEYSYFERFEECIAYIINYLWQDLTEEEKQQMKKILE